jgi:hypothetical protein
MKRQTDASDGDSAGSFPLRLGAGEEGELRNQHVDVYRIVSSQSTPRFSSPSMSVGKSRFLAAVFLRRQKISLQAWSNGAGLSSAFGEGAAELFWFPFFSAISGGEGTGFVLPLLCERVGFSIGIPDGFCGATDDVGGGGLFLSSVTTAVDFSSSSFLHKTTTEVHSSMKMYLGGVTGLCLLRLHQHLTLLVKFGDGSCLVSSCLRRTAARAAAGRLRCRGCVV